MKTRPQDPREFNTPAEMLARGLLLMLLASSAAGILLVLAGFITQLWHLLVAGLGSLAVAALTRHWLQRTGKLDSADVTFDVESGSYPGADDTRVAELVRLLQEWEAMEKKRGSAGFDPWALQSMRHDIRALVESDRALDELLSARRVERERHAA